MMFKTDSMRRAAKASAVTLMALGLALSGGASAYAEGASAHVGKKGKASSPSTASSILPVGYSPVKGNKDALVTIVEFADYQCPFCKKANDTMAQVEAKYGKDVRVVFKHFPLPFHQQADDASRAALAAGEQGKYWEMHDVLFENYGDFKNHSADFDDYAVGLAREAGVKDLKKFSKDLSSNVQKYDNFIQLDKALGSALGVRGTPNFFINGVRVSGAQPINKFEEVIDAELKASRAALKKLGKKKLVYAARVKENYTRPEVKKPSGAAKAKAKPVVFVPVSKKDAMMGKTSKALVTIVEFSDFQCPYCSRGANTMRAIEAKYGKDVRIVFKNLPLPFHKQAEGAAVAALAAGRQGKFWEMHDKLFERQKEMRGNPELFVQLADELGLKLSRFEKDLKDPKLLAQVKADAALAGEVGARGTPNFFINGIQLVGARPEADFSKVIDEQIKLAKKLKKKKKLKGEKLYAALVKENEKSVPEEEKVDAKKLRKDEKAKAAEARKILAVAGSPVWGDAKKAKVVIYEFTDLQCPFCSRGKDTIDQVKKAYGADVAVVSKAFPLAFHKEAEAAAIAALAAGRQGKFWEMRSAIFERQRDMKSNTELFIELADGLGLDLDRFEKDLKDQALLQQVKDEMAMGSRLGVRGTPNFFVNGVQVTGAQPFDAFKKVIDAQLDDAKK